MSRMVVGEKRLDQLLLEDVLQAGLWPRSAALDFYQGLQKALLQVGTDRPELAWGLISQQLLRPHHPHSLHQLVYYSAYRDWDVSKRGPPPAWCPTLESAKATSLGKLLESRGKEFLGSAYKDPIASFPAFQRFSVEHPEIYWPLTFEELSLFFHVQPRSVVEIADDGYPGGKWLAGAVLNVAECCLLPKTSINKTDESIAVIWRDEGLDDLPPQTLTLSQLRAEVSRVANALQVAGFRQGDRIAIDMPMHVRAVVIYLAIILAGCVVVSIADSFVAPEIAVRLRVSKTKAIFTQDAIVRSGKTIPLYRRVADANPLQAIVLPANGKSLTVDLRDRDISWETFLDCTNNLKQPHLYTPVPLPIEAWTNILFSSGTTAEPKAIPWNQTTGIRCASDSWAHSDLKPGDVYCWPTNLGWMMGPYLIYACLLTGATIALYNGAPLGREFGRFVQDAGVTNLGTVPSIVKTWKRTGCMDSLDWSTLRVLATTGEASSLDDDLWLSSRASYKPILECCGGTELGSAFLHGSLLQPQAFATFSTPGLTMSFVLLDDASHPYPDDQPCVGEIALMPRMLGASWTLLNADHHKVYFQGMPTFNGMRYRRHGDMFERMVGGYYKAQGRADDSMNLGGIKVSAVEIERVCNGADDSVLETAAIALPPEGGGPDNLVIATVLRDSRHPSDSKALKQAFQAAIQSTLNPLFKVHAVVFLPEFPRTASNKIMRRTIRAQLKQQGISRL